MDFFANAAPRPLAARADRLLAFCQKRFGLWRDHASAAALVAAGAHETGDAAAAVVSDGRGGAFPALRRHVRSDEDLVMAAARLLDYQSADAALLADPSLAAARRDAVAYLESLAA